MWILVICTAGWLGLCGSYVEIPYPTEEKCMQQQGILLKDTAKYDYVVCKPKGEK